MLTKHMKANSYQPFKPEVLALGESRAGQRPGKKLNELEWRVEWGGYFIKGGVATGASEECEAPRDHSDSKKP